MLRGSLLQRRLSQFKRVGVLGFHVLLLVAVLSDLFADDVPELLICLGLM